MLQSAGNFLIVTANNSNNYTNHRHHHHHHESELLVGLKKETKFRAEDFLFE